MLEQSVVLINGTACDYDKLPAICSDMMPAVQNIQFMYTLIILSGLMVIVLGLYLVWMMNRYIRLQMELTGAKSFGELLEIAKRAKKGNYVS